jgi:hypothetical protein
MQVVGGGGATLWELAAQSCHDFHALPNGNPGRQGHFHAWHLCLVWMIPNEKEPAERNWPARKCIKAYKLAGLLRRQRALAKNSPT